jgi:23S rRNA (adenine2503-C2)-methyltransferase
MFNGNACTLKEINKVMDGVIPNGRKITLNFAVADWEISGEILREYFDPDDYVVKLTPMHKTNTALENNIKTKGDYVSYYPYEEAEKECKKHGFDVLVFMASEYEDLSCITCGNAILGGSKIKTPYTKL